MFWTRTVKRHVVGKNKEMKINTKELRTRQREYEKKYRAENKERTRNADKKYYEKNKDRILHAKREYRVKNNEAVLLQKKEYYARNKVRIRLRDLKKYCNEGHTKNVTNARLKKSLLMTMRQLEAGEITPKECEKFISSANEIAIKK